MFAACCLLPSVLLSLGIAGAWVGTLDSLARYEWIFIAAAALLGSGFYLAGQSSNKGGGSGGE
jgi:mercuric ion transport protein